MFLDNGYIRLVKNGYRIISLFRGNSNNIMSASLHDNIVWYTEYFAMASIAGVRRASALFPAIVAVQLSDAYTMERPSKGPVAKSDFLEILQNAYELIYSGGLSLEPMRRAFLALSNYIMEVSGMTVDDYFTAKGIKVPKVYANLSNSYGYPVNSGNVR